MSVNHTATEDSIKAQVKQRFNAMKAELKQDYSTVIIDNTEVINSLGKYEQIPLDIVTLWELNNVDGLSWESSSEQLNGITYSIFELPELEECLLFEENEDAEYIFMHEDAAGVFKDYLVLCEDNQGFLDFNFYSETEYYIWLDSIYDNEDYIVD